MPSAREIAEEVSKVLDGRLSIDAFEDWVASYSWNLHKRADEETQSLAYEVELKLAEFSSGDMNEDILLKGLANAVRPFLQPRVSVPQVRFVVGEPWYYAGSASEPLELAAVAGM